MSREPWDKISLQESKPNIDEEKKITKNERLFARRHPKTFAVLFATNFRPRPPAGHHLFPVLEIDRRQTMMSSIIHFAFFRLHLTYRRNLLHIFFISSSLCHLTNFLNSHYQKWHRISMTSNIQKVPNHTILCFPMLTTVFIHVSKSFMEPLSPFTPFTTTTFSYYF